MFANVGWGEILLILVVALVVVGPEKLPKLVQDFRAVILAVRNSIDDARKELKNDFGDDFEEFQKPLQDLQALRGMNPKSMLTRTLLEGDDTMLNFLDKKPADFIKEDSAAQASATQAPAAQQATNNNAQAAAKPEAARNTNWADDDVM